jgi:hypothetical protein
MGRDWSEPRRTGKKMRPGQMFPARHRKPGCLEIVAATAVMLGGLFFGVGRALALW